jgi:hypothetical protein
MDPERWRGLVVKSEELGMLATRRSALRAESLSEYGV